MPRIIYSSTPNVADRIARTCTGIHVSILSKNKLPLTKEETNELSVGDKEVERILNKEENKSEKCTISQFPDGSFLYAKTDVPPSYAERVFTTNFPMFGVHSSLFFLNEETQPNKLKLIIFSLGQLQGIVIKNKDPKINFPKIYNIFFKVYSLRSTKRELKVCGHFDELILIKHLYDIKSIHDIKISKDENAAVTLNSKNKEDDYDNYTSRIIYTIVNSGLYSGEVELNFVQYKLTDFGCDTSKGIIYTSLFKRIYGLRETRKNIILVNDSKVCIEITTSLTSVYNFNDLIDFYSILLKDINLPYKRVYVRKASISEINKITHKIVCYTVKPAVNIVPVSSILKRSYTDFIPETNKISKEPKSKVLCVREVDDDKNELGTTTSVDDNSKNLNSINHNSIKKEIFIGIDEINKEISECKKDNPEIGYNLDELDSKISEDEEENNFGSFKIDYNSLGDIGQMPQISFSFNFNNLT